MGQFDSFGGSIGESTKFNYNRTEVVQVNLSLLYMRLFGGYKILEVPGKNRKFRFDLHAYLGIRIQFHRVYSDLNGIINSLDVNPVWAEPIIGVRNQFIWKKWLLQFQGDYGGYFIPEKQSFQLSTNIYFRTGRLTSLKVGWNHLSLIHKGNFDGKDYKVKAMLSGPAIGITFHF